MNQPNPPYPLAPVGPSGMSQPWYEHDRMTCRRKILAIAPTFEIFDSHGRPLVYCQEKLFKIKDDIRIYSDASKRTSFCASASATSWTGRASST